MPHFIPQLVQQSGNDGGKRLFRHRGIPVVTGAAGDELQVLRDPDAMGDGEFPNTVRLIEPDRGAVDRAIPKHRGS